MGPTAIPHPSLKAITPRSNTALCASFRIFRPARHCEVHRVDLLIMTAKVRTEDRLLMLDCGFSAKAANRALLPTLRHPLKHLFPTHPTCKHA